MKGENIVHCIDKDQYDFVQNALGRCNHKWDDGGFPYVFLWEEDAGSEKYIKNNKHHKVYSFNEWEDLTGNYLYSRPINDNNIDCLIKVLRKLKIK